MNHGMLHRKLETSLLDRLQRNRKQLDGLSSSCLDRQSRRALNPRSVFLFRLNLVIVQYQTSCLILRGCWLSGHWYGRRIHGIGMVADFYRTYPWNGVQIAWFASSTHARLAIAIFWFVRSVAVLSRQFVSKPTDNEIKSGVQRCFSSAVIFSVQRSNA
jgi:hypothetical protein